MALQHEGVLVWLDNHMLDSDWCCHRQDCEGFWFNSHFSEDDWVKAWTTLAKRYADVPAVVGVGLKNEPRSVCGGRSWGGKGDFCNATLLDPSVDAMGCAEMTWATGPAAFQWRRAAARAGRAVLVEKPSLLVSVSGLEYSTDLRDFASHPVDLPSDRMVSEAHEYSWSRYSRSAGQTLSGQIEGHGQELSDDDAKSLCDDLGGVCSGYTCERGLEGCTVRAGDLLLESNSREVTNRKELAGCDPFPRYAEKLNTWWGFLLQRNVTPVFLSEFGFSQTFAGDLSENCWVQHLSTYIQEGGPLAKEGGLDWAYWQLGGVQEGGTSRTAGASESFGVLNRCWTGPASAKHIGALQRLMEPAGGQMLDKAKSRDGGSSGQSRNLLDGRTRQSESLFE